MSVAEADGHSPGDRSGGLDGEPPFRVLPRVTDDDEHFWTGGEHGELRIQRCRECRTWIHPGAPVCPACLSRDVAPEVASGRGEVHTYTINVQPWNPTFEHPYVIAVIELDEQPGLRITSNVYGCDPDDVHVGMRVEVFFELFEDVWLPLFRPETAAEGADA